jgi:hypothetical protein
MQLPVTGGNELAGASGWAGAGLLGLVLAWLLLKHLPAKDAQIERMVANHEAEIARAVTDQRKDFRDMLEQILQRGDARNATLAAAISKDMEALHHAIRFERVNRGERPGT